MTQSQLAEAVGTSQQQIQRIETGIQIARFDIALLICKILETKMEKVFPKANKVLLKSTKRCDHISDIFNDEKIINEMEESGVDISLGITSFEYRLRGGTNGECIVCDPDYRRLWYAVQRTSPDDPPFVVFNSEGSSIVLNLNHLIFCRFKYDIPKDPKEENNTNVKIFMSDTDIPMIFDVDPDEGNPNDENDNGQFRNILSAAQTYLEKNEIYSFYDGDEDKVFLRAEDIAMMEIPLWVVEPDLLDDDFDKDVDG